MILALKAGEIDFMAGSIPATAARELEKEPNIKVEATPGGLSMVLAFNLREGRLGSDINLRKAIAHAIDKQLLIDVIYLGFAEPIDNWFFGEYFGNPTHTPDPLPQYEYDIDKANEILDNAGYIDSDGNDIRNDPTTGDDLVFEVVTTQASEQVRMAELIGEMVTEIGIKFTKK